MQFFLDVTRLATRIFRSGPTGIDRVEYAYARHMIDGPGTVCVFTAPMFSGAIREPRARDILARVERAWRLQATCESDAVFAALRGWLEAPFAPGWGRILRDADFWPLRDILRAETRLQRRVARAGAEPTMFFHCSHAQLDRPERFGWLKKWGVRSTFFLHDAIPVEYPEFCSPGARERHFQRLTTVSAHASLVIVNSQDSRRAVAAAMAERGLNIPPIEVVPLAVDEAFVKAAKAPRRPPAIPYFVYVGTIEPRKNLLFLLSIWRRFAETLGDKTPRLVLAGRRGWENENIVDVLERSRGLAPYIAEASGLTDAGLARLVADSSGLVSPSLTEGFGLPVVESLAAGTPAIVSDIAAHREAGGAYATYIDAIDGPGWIEAILAHADAGSPLRAERLARIAEYRPMDWAEHVGRVRALMERAGA